MNALHEQLRGLEPHVEAAMGGAAVQLQPIPGTVPVVQVSIDGRQELPIFLTSAETQLLWSDAEIRPDKRAEFMETLLDLNPSVPLSAFGRVGDRFVLSGALRRDAGVEEIAREVVVLSDNALDALDALSDYLV
jgi:uncharacterized protein YjfI (DUF2170 family)